MLTMRYDIDPKSLIGQKVRCYCNVSVDCWSIEANVNGKWLVVAHTAALVMDAVILSVSEAGRKRVREQQRKNVHARVIGRLVALGEAPEVVGRRIRYNPYNCKSFVYADDSSPVMTAQRAYFLTGKRLVEALSKAA